MQLCFASVEKFTVPDVPLGRRELVQAHRDLRHREQDVGQLPGGRFDRLLGEITANRPS